MGRIRRVAAACALSIAAVRAAPLSIEGKVVEDHSGSPLASASVRIFKIGVSRAVADLETDRGGYFRASGLSAGDHRIEVPSRTT